MTKDYLKFRNAIKKDQDLTLEEGYMLEILFDYYNTSLGYAYPSYEVLMEDLKTKRKAKVSKLLKALVKKDYIAITKVGKKNTYKLLKYLFINNNIRVGSKGDSPLDGQIHFTKITDEEKEIIDLGFTPKEAKKLLKAAKDKADRIVKAFKYATEKGADNLYSYTLWAINNISKIKKNLSDVDAEWNPITKFDNFKPREYDYDDLEKKLLGWG